MEPRDLPANGIVGRVKNSRDGNASRMRRTTNPLEATGGTVLLSTARGEGGMAIEIPGAGTTEAVSSSDAKKRIAVSFPAAAGKLHSRRAGDLRAGSTR